MRRSAALSVPGKMTPERWASVEGFPEEGGRRAVPAAAPPRQKAGPAWRAALGPWPHPGPGGHLREAG